jgi:uncharacterized membrane protein YfcA
MEFAGYLSLIFMGLTLSLMGAGGSILTIPILIYLFHIPLITSTTYSLVIVGLTAFIATLTQRDSILFKKSISFMAPSIVGVFFARFYMVPALTQWENLLPINSLLMIMLFILMVLGGYFMVKDSPLILQIPSKIPSNHLAKTYIFPLGLGFLMGVLGTGGGFLIIPALVIFLGFTAEEAIPTSLLIISGNSLTGFLWDQYHLSVQDWMNLLTYLTCTLTGIFPGIYFRRFIHGINLKKFFGYFIWIISFLIFSKEFIL